MRIEKLLLLAVFSLILSCKQNTTSKDNVLKVNPDVTEKKTAVVFDKSLLKKMIGNSFVLSCGSGCAMQYNVKHIDGNRSRIKVGFSVKMFEDEKETDNYLEDFFFYYSNDHKLLKIIREGETESFLPTQMPSAQREFTNFAQRLIMEMNNAIAKDK